MAYALAVSIGNVDTVAAVSPAGRPKRLPLGSGVSAMPSAVFLSREGEWAVGEAALALGVDDPARLERSPRRSAAEGPLLLGARLASSADTLGAIVRRALSAAEADAGERPSDLRLTVPVSWRAPRRAQLSLAAQAVGYDDVSLVPEPVGVALALGGPQMPEGGHVAVYQFGAGAFEATVLRRRKLGFEVVGQPGGRDPLGGEDVDELILRHLSEGASGRHPEWRLLLDPPDAAWRRAALDLRAAVRRAKEELSAAVATTVAVPRLGLAPQLTRPELDGLITPLVDQTIDVLQSTVAAAGLSVRELAAVYLAGGTSRIPFVADRVWERLEVRPVVSPDPEGCAALGAVAGVAEHRLTRAAPFRGRLVAATVTQLWRPGSVGSAYLLLAGDRTTVRVSDEPSRGSGAEDLARAAGDLLAGQRNGYTEVDLVPARVLDRTDGLERRYMTAGEGGPEHHFERYLHLGERWIVVRASERARDVADRLRIEPPAVDPRRFFELRIGAELADGWHATERLVLVRNESGHRVVAESYGVVPGAAAALDAEQVAVWRAGAFAAAGHVEIGRGRGRFLGRHEAAVVTLRGATEGVVTRIWAGIVEGRRYTVVATVPARDRLVLGLLENHITLR